MEVIFMTKQKRGFWLFISSLLPGAGELYMGFRKMGLSLMVLFWGCIACASLLGFDALIYLLPIIWFYSFFNVHNLKSLSEEEFHSLEDHFIPPVEEFEKNRGKFVKQYRNILAVLLIILGISGIWDILTSWIRVLVPEEMYHYIDMFGYQLPTMALSIGCILIVLGVLLIVHLFVPKLTYTAILNYWPVTLILLGIEILVANFRSEKETFTYDGWSIVLMFLILGFTMCMGILDWILVNVPNHIYL